MQSITKNECCLPPQFTAKLFTFKLFLSGILVMWLSMHAAFAATRDVTVLMPDPLDTKGEPAPIPTDRQRMLDFIAHEADLHFDFQRYPWKRILLLAENGDGLIFGISKTSARERMFHFSKPLYANYVWLVTRKDARFDYKEITDLRGRSVGIVSGTHYGDSFDEHKGRLFRVESDPNSMMPRFNKLINRRMDVMVMQDPGNDAHDLEERINRYVGKQLAADGLPAIEFSVLPRPLLVDNIHFAIRADKDEGLINRIDAAIGKGKKQGVMNLDIPKSRN